jgi:hypothetical protein
MSILAHVSDYFVGEYLPGSTLETIVEETSGAFYLDHERSIPTLYMGALLLLCAFLLTGITLSRRAVGASYVRHWAILAIVFLYLSTDELLSIHEETVEPLRSIVGIGGGLLYFAWVVPALSLVLIFGLLYAKFVFDLPAKIRLLFLISGSLYVAGSLGLEMVGGYYASSYGTESAGFIVETTAEELLEMLGLAVFTYALLEFMRSYVEEIVISPESNKR